MRILFLAHRLPYPPNKGDKIRSFWELKSMCARHEVDVFCFYDDGEDAKYVADMRQLCHHFYAEAISPVWSRARALLSVATHRPFSIAYYYSSTMAAQVRQALHQRGYDLIWVFSSSMAQYAESSSLPKVIDFVDVDSDKWQQYADRSHGPSAWLWSYEARQLARYEDEIAATFSASVLCTEAEARILRARVKEPPVHALNNHLDVTYFDPQGVQVTPEIRALQPYVIFAGQMDYYPNVDAAGYFCREIFPSVRAQLPDMKFVIVGRNPVSAVRKLADHPAVHVTGTVPDIRPYLRGASAAVMPLRIARGVQNKVLEAMAMGLPVVASPAIAASLPGSVAAQLIMGNTAQDMSEKICALLRDRKTPPLAGVRDAVVAHFGGSAFETQLEAIIASTVRGWKDQQAASAAASAVSGAAFVPGEERAGMSRHLLPDRQA